MNMEIRKIVAEFVSGVMDIDRFMIYIKETDSICQYLQEIVDSFAKEGKIPARRTITMRGVAQNKPFQARSYVEDFIPELRKNNRAIFDLPGHPIPTVKQELLRSSHKTAYGASRIHGIVSDIYYQIDPALERTEYYHENYSFSLEVLPRYIAGAEAESFISEHIIPKYPQGMKLTERKKLIKQDIQAVFRRDCKGYPHWIQDPEWPIGSDGLPMVYKGQKKSQNYTDYFFRGNTLEEEKTVRQHW